MLRSMLSRTVKIAIVALLVAMGIATCATIYVDSNNGHLIAMDKINEYCEYANEQESTRCYNENLMLRRIDGSLDTIKALLTSSTFIISLLIAIDIFTRKDCKCENSNPVKTKKK